MISILSRFDTGLGRLGYNGSEPDGDPPGSNRTPVNAGVPGASKLQVLCTQSTGPNKRAKSMASKDALSKTSRYLHWMMATLILTLLAIGFYMVNTESFGLYNWHKSFGLVALLLIVLRMIYRLELGSPEPVRQYPRHEPGGSVADHHHRSLAGGFVYALCNV